MANQLQQQIRSPQATINRLDKLTWTLESHQKRLQEIDDHILDLTSFLGIADRTTTALESLSNSLFEEVLGVLETNLSRAIEEVIGQPISFKANADFKRGAAAVSFSIERDGNSEDVLRGQGGSVQNVLSVGLRMFALATLDPNQHRPFLVLDEQDCWLRWELVPKLVNIIHRAARELDFQVLMISHHELRLFEQWADKIYRFTPRQGAVTAEVVPTSLAPNETNQNR